MVVAARNRHSKYRMWAASLQLLAILFAGLTLALPAPAISQEAPDNPVELLRLESVRVERVSTPEVRSDQLKNLVDQNPDTTCDFSKDKNGKKRSKSTGQRSNNIQATRT